MSSLMQFSGPVNHRGVGLRLYVTSDGTSLGTELEVNACTKCGRSHAVIHEAYRKPVGMFGCWVVFRMNGKEIVPDLSIPIPVGKLPRDARRLTWDECMSYWHSP